MPRLTALERAQADVEQARHDRDRAMDALSASQQNLTEAMTERDLWRGFRLPDPEADCLSGCVRAIEALLNPPTSPNAYGEANRYSPMRFGETTTPRLTANETPVGRILLNLAARYGVPLAAFDPPPVVEVGQRLVVAPADLASQIEAVVNGPGLR